MLSAIGVSDIETLFDEIPADLRVATPESIPAALSEMECSRLMGDRAAQDGRPLSFIGAGAYEHHIPAVVWELATRGEFYTAYTPYQAEASQGTLQLLYEFQSMLTQLTALEVANASLYDGASALAEAVLMAVRANRKSKSKKILMPATVHPHYRATVDAIVRNQGIELVDLPYCSDGGNTLRDSLSQYEGEDFAALIIPQPNFFGALEAVDELTDWAHANKMLVIGVVNPLALALLTPPGEWGESGADIAVGEGQPLGIPLSSGGPYFGFMCAKQAYVRQMPGRIVGRTVDIEGKEGFTLTLQAREQHIRRSKATSNICTNQGLMTTAATIHMALVGGEGMRRTAAASHANTAMLVEKLAAVEGVEKIFNRPFFHEVVLRFEPKLKPILRALEAQNLLGGYLLEEHYPELENCLLVCVTETKSEGNITKFAENIARIIERQGGPICTKLRPKEPL